MIIASPKLLANNTEVLVRLIIVSAIREPEANFRLLDGVNKKMETIAA